MTTGHAVHTGHDHVHGPECGHATAEHEGHVDYIHEGHAHASHEGHYDEHSLPHVAHEQHGHTHGDSCGHEAVSHGDHVDYVHDGHHHAAHAGHYDEHQVREGGRTINVHCLIATGVNADGHREILGVDVTSSEDGAGWLAFLRGLVARGLSGVALVISDDHAGLVNAIASVLPAPPRRPNRDYPHPPDIGCDRTRMLSYLPL